MIAMRDKGVTLVELLVVVSIVCALAFALAFEYTDWIGRYRVETQIREMYFDLMDARARAMLRKRAHFVSLAQTHYTVQEDISPWPDGDRCLSASDSTRPAGYNDPIPLLRKDLYRDLPLTWNNIRVAHMRFNARGFSNTNRTICVNTDKKADYDCIAISAARIRLGRLKKKIPDGGICNSENCIIK